MRNDNFNIKLYRKSRVESHHGYRYQHGYSLSHTGEMRRDERKACVCCGELFQPKNRKHKICDSCMETLKRFKAAETPEEIEKLQENAEGIETRIETGAETGAEQMAASLHDQTERTTICE